jgi:hypothetical protein
MDQVTDGRITAWLRRNIKWKKWSPYFNATLVPIHTSEYGRIYSRGDTHYLVTNDEIGKIPRYMALTLMGINRETYHWGPYTFYNEFENTQKKVVDIKFDYNMWFEEDQSFIKAMEERYETV